MVFVWCWIKVRAFAIVILLICLSQVGQIKYLFMKNREELFNGNQRVGRTDNQRMHIMQV